VIGNSATGLPLILDTTTSGATGASANSEPTPSLYDDLRSDQSSVEEIELKTARVRTGAASNIISAPATSEAGAVLQPKAGDSAPIGGN
jgi:hypothetical protein